MSQRKQYDEIIINQIKSQEIDLDAVAGIIYSKKIDMIGNKHVVGYPSKYGYLLFGFNDGKTNRQFSVCRAIWLAVNGKINGELQVEHRDGNKFNNRIDNLFLKEPNKIFNPKRWTNKELSILKDNRKSGLSLPQLALKLGRSIKSVRHKIKFLNLPSKAKKKHIWSKEDDNQLKKLYCQHMSVEKIANILDRSAWSVRLRANRVFNIFRSDIHLVKTFKDSKDFYLALKRSFCHGTSGARCCLCDYQKYIELHHIDGNRNNNVVSNIASLCPNHHTEVTYGEHKDKKLYCIWWRIYSDKSCSIEYDNKSDI